MTDLDLDEIMTLYWPAILRSASASGDDWLKGFTRSIARNAKRTGWLPTPKQAQLMKRLVVELRTSPDHDVEVIER
ncbi:MAG: hypothetical protein ACSHXD_19970 [Marinosulfonomonas sp.]